MIRKTLLALCSLAFLASCDNDLDITANWKDVPVLYGILNSQDTTHYIKLNKAFLGQGDIMMMAQEFDSLYYNEEQVGLRLVEYSLEAVQYIEDLEVDCEYGDDTACEKLEWIRDCINGNDCVYIEEDQFNIKSEIRTIEMEPTDEFVKPDGIFSSPTQIIYKTNAQLNTSRFYTAEVYILDTDSIIASNSIPIDVLSSLQMTTPNPFSPLNFVPNGYASKAEWLSLEGGKLYELKIRFYYVEQQITDLSDTVQKHIDWVFPYRQSTSTSGAENMSITLDAQQFLNFLAINIEEDSNVYRQVTGMVGVQGPTGFSITHSCMDFTLLAAGEELSTYIMLNENSSSIVINRPEYSNIDNGIGILSSRSIDFTEDIKINNFSNDEIAFNEITKHLNFAYFRLGDDSYIDTLYVN